MSMISRLLTGVLLAIVPTVPAGAAPPAPAAEPRLGRLTLGPGGPEKLTLLWVRPEHVTPATEHRVRLTVDASAVTRFADVDLALIDHSVAITADEARSSGPGPGPCRRSAGTFSCDWTATFFQEGSLEPVAVLVARPRSAAATGDQGEIVVTTRLGDGPARTGTSAVRIGQGVDLAAGEPIEVRAAPGRTVTATPTVRVGAAGVDGVVLVLDADQRLLGRSSHRNCRYYGTAVVCTFATALQPGRSYAVTTPFVLRPPADAVPGSEAPLRHQWLTAADWADWRASIPDDDLGAPGTGDELALVEVTAAQSDPQVDVQPLNDSSVITLTVAGAGRVDLAAVGSRHTAAVGSAVVLTAGVRNRGPGTLRPDLFPNNAVAATVRLPRNVRPTDADSLCGRAWDVGEVVEYHCELRGTLAPGHQATFGFPVETVDDCGTAGSVEVADRLPGVAFGRATGRGDDVAAITVRVPGARCGALPITGPAARGLALAGSVLIAVGLVLAVRRVRRPVCEHAERETRPPTTAEGTMR